MSESLLFLLVNTSLAITALALVLGWIINLFRVVDYHLEMGCGCYVKRPSYYSLRLLGIFITPLGTLMGFVR